MSLANSSVSDPVPCPAAAHVASQGMHGMQGAFRLRFNLPAGCDHTIRPGDCILTTTNLTFKTSKRLHVAIFLFLSKIRPLV
jgi:hypothetical protein